MNKNELVEYGDYLLSVALSKIDNIEDAKDLVSETMIVALCAIEKGIQIDSPKTYLYGILNHKLMDRFRIKYSKHIVYYGVIPDFDEGESKKDSVLERIINSEDSENIRRSLASLTQNYRQVLVRYYFYDQKIKKIADELKINENTVKFRLSYGRMNIKENVFMEKYEKQSFDPERLTVGVYGWFDVESSQNPFVVNRQDRVLDQNILILAYDKPVTLEELSKALGVAVTFVEPIVNRLIDGDFMKRIGNKVYTNFIISTDQDNVRICQNDKKVANEIYADFWQDMEKVFAELEGKEYYKKLNEGQKRNIKQFTAVNLMQQMTFVVKNEKFPDFQDCKQTDENNHNGWWGYAGGERTNPNVKQDWSENGFMPYKMNGCFTYSIEQYKDLKRLGVAAYDLSSGKTFTAWWGAPKYMTEQDFMKCCYAIYSGTEEEIPEINKNFFENIGYFINCNILKMEDNKISLNIAVLKNEEAAEYEKYLDAKAKELAKKYKIQLDKLFDEKINYPSHIQGIPEFIQYQNNGSYFPMAMIYRATADKYLVGENLAKNPIPAMYFFVSDK